MVKMTFTFDEETVKDLRETATRLERSRSQVAREAIHEYAERVGKLTSEERRRLLRVFDSVVPVIPTRPASEVDQEIEAVRAARRRGGRRVSTHRR